MKIALCLSGQMRAMKHCIHTIETAFPDCDVDIYATIWEYEDNKNISRLKYNSNVVYLDKITNEDLAIHKVFEREVIRRGFSGKHNIRNWAPIPVWNLIRIEMMAKNSFRPVTSDYDYVVRSRFDMKYLQDLRPLLSKDSILLSEDIGGSSPGDTWKDTRQVFDGFAAGSFTNMLKYYGFTTWLPSYFNYHDEVLKAERTLGWYLEKVINVNRVYKRDILGIQINDEEWYNRSTKERAESLDVKQEATFNFYKEDMKKNHPDIFHEIESCFD